MTVPSKLDTLALAFLDTNINADGIANVELGLLSLMLPSEIIFSASILNSSICF